MRASLQFSDVDLRPAEPADAPLLMTWRAEPSTVRHNPLEGLTIEELRRRLAAGSADLSDPVATEFRWLILFEGKPSGTVSLKGVNRHMGTGEIGYGVSEICQGKRIGRKAVALLVDRIFEHTPLERLVALIDTSNTPSWHLIESLGFVREGTLRQHFVIRGQRVDEFHYGLMRSEWEAGRDRIAETIRLSPSSMRG